MRKKFFTSVSTVSFSSSYTYPEKRKMMIDREESDSTTIANKAKIHSPTTTLIIPSPSKIVFTPTSNVPNASSTIFSLKTTQVTSLYKTLGSTSTEITRNLKISKTRDCCKELILEAKGDALKYQHFTLGTYKAYTRLNNR